MPREATDGQFEGTPGEEIQMNETDGMMPDSTPG